MGFHELSYLLVFDKANVHFRGGTKKETTVQKNGIIQHKQKVMDLS